MPEILDANQLFDLHKSGDEYKIIRIFDHTYRERPTYGRYLYKMLYFVIKEEEMKQIQEEKDIKDNVIDYQEAKLKHAAKEPPRRGNWLSDMVKGTRFLASKGSGEELTDYMVGTDPKAMPAVYLGYNLAGRDGGFKFVDPVKFCNNWNFHSIIRTDIFKQEVDEHNGNAIEVRTGAVEGDGERQVLPPLHEE